MRGPNTAYRPRPEEAQGIHFTAPNAGGSLERTGGAVVAGTADPNEIVLSARRELVSPEPPVDHEPLRIVMTSLDKNIDNFAREAAHEKLSKKQEGDGLVKRMAKSIWSNITREYQVVKATQDARQEIIENKNLRHHHGESDLSWRDATVRRWGSDYAEHLIHEDAGESFARLNAEKAATDPNVERIRTDSLDALREYALGEIADEASLELTIEQLQQEWKEAGISQEYIGEGLMLAHNFIPLGNQLRAALDAREGLSRLAQEALLDQMLAGAEIVTGEAKVGSRVEIESTLSERLAEKMKDVPFLNEGRLAAVTAAVSNETVVAAMISAAAFGMKGALGRAGAMVLPGLGAGVVAFIRERRALRDERALTARRLDAGQEIDADEKAQAELGETMYATRSAGELLDELGGLYNEAGELNITDKNGLKEAMLLQAEIQARIQIEDREGKRLINFADISPEEMEARRFDIDLAMAKLEVDLRRLYEDPAAQGMLDIEKGYDEASDDERSMLVGMLKGEMTKQDRLFKKIVGWRGFKKAVAATFIGAAIGVALHEIAVGGRNVREVLSYIFKKGAPASPDMELVGETTTLGTPDQVGGETPGSVGTEGTPDQVGATPDQVGGVPEQVGGRGTPDAVGVEGNTPNSVGASPETPGYVGNPEGVLSDTSKISQLPEGYTIERDGSVAVLTGPEGGTLRLDLNKDGSLSESAKSTLNEAGFNLMDRPDVVAGEPQVSTVEVTPSQFVENHRSDMVEIAEVRWMHNMTEGSNLNELGLHNELQSNGNIVISVAGMTSGGSFDEAGALDLQEAQREGKLSIFLSASPGTRAHAIELPVRADGTVVVEPGSPAAALFNEEGKFIGGYQQAAIKDELADGRVRIASLATVVGENRPDTFTDTVETPTVETAHTYVISEMAQTAVASPEVSPQFDTYAPVIPLVGRRRLGEAIAPQAPEPEPEEPELPPALAPVIPLPRPALPSAEARAAAEAAESRGLPSAEQQEEPPTAARATTTGPTVTPPPTPGATPETPETETTDPYEGLSPEEVPYVQDIDNERRVLPQGYDLDLSSYSDRERKLLITAVYEAEARFPRGATENEWGYRRRIVRELQKASQIGRSQMGVIPPGLRPFFAGAFKAMTEVQVKRPPRTRPSRPAPPPPSAAAA